MDKLKPCPFCGGEAEILTAESMHGGYLFGIMCNDCRSRGDVFDTEAESIKAWNTRKPMQNIEAYVRMAIQEAERTCKNVYEGSDIDRYMMFKCSNCGCVLANHYYPKGWIEQEHTDDEFFAYDGERLNYCPNCGAKVIGG